MNNPITVMTVVAAPIALVWEACTSPEHITQWNAASSEWCCPEAESDLRVGGRFRSRMEARDGSEGFDFAGVYTEVVPQERIAYIIDDGRQVVVTFTPREQGTMVETQFEPEGENSLELQQAGWQAILDNFRQYVEELSR